MELIKTTSEGKQAVSARELYQALGLTEGNYAKWSNKNISKNSFAVESVDYQTLRTQDEGRPTIDFALSPDFAKKLAMLARTDKGEEVRNYFIACERKALAPRELSRMELIQLAMQSEQERMLLEEKVGLQEKVIMQQAPKVEYVNTVLNSNSTFTTNQIAKELGMSAITLNLKLAERKVQYKQSGNWLLYHHYQNKGYTKTKTYLYTDSEGKQQTSIQMVWSEKGREFLHRLFNESLTNKLKTA